MILVGQKQIIRMRFRPDSGYASPTTVVCRVKKPDDSLATVTVTPTLDENDDPIPGWFQGEFTPASAGLHVARADGTGNVDGVGEFPFMVHEPSVPAP